ncbi:hypothetical protein OQZ33_04365 [Pedobacter sp. MC2016-05]|uniref:hypothetical protein n=1 Tax=Pedobacter sp. MC2016-05 TaxID=2994474 RepID=UPI002246993B|nr:hypothetical protein [Pedobacter sp. MC2016-05]MCX2473560.1 hypothetical protein [Pedobacter sp. MC2016-05]
MKYDSVTNLGLSFGDGDDNPSGISEKAWLIPLSWMKTIVKPTVGTTAGSVVAITGNHLMKVGKAPIECSILFDKSGINWKLAGEKLSKIFEQGAEIFVPNNSVTNLGTARGLKNYRFICLFGKLDDSGHFYQIGSEEISATVTDAAGGTGVGPTGEVGTKFTLQSYAQAPVFSYEGTIPPVGA